MAATAAPFGLWRLFLVFAKIGAVLFGSGYVLLAFLQGDLVDRLHWLTERQLLDAVAVGQVTPGPVFTTATFIGYIIGGVPGAVVATVGIFAPGFVYVALSGWLVPRIRRSRVAASMLDGVVVGSLALMGVVAWQLGRAAIIDCADAGDCHCEHGAVVEISGQFGMAHRDGRRLRMALSRVRTVPQTLCARVGHDGFEE